MPRAVVMFDSQKPLEVHEVVLADPQPHELRVRVAASGVCHSDLSVYEGQGLGTPLPTVMGHEAAGIVEAVGDDVTEFALGDHVVLTVVPQCGTCLFCAAGQPTLCIQGGRSFVGVLQDGTSRVTLDGAPVSQAAGMGAWSQAAIVPDTAAVKIDKDMPLAQAALIGCGVITGFGAAVNVGRVQPGEKVLVLGCGGVGLNAVQGARIAGAEQVIAVDILQNKLDYATALGATDTVDSSAGDFGEAVRELTGGIGVDVALDFVGAGETGMSLLSSIRRGGRCVVTAVSGSMWQIPAGMLIGGASTISGNLLGMSHFKTDIPKLVGLYQDGSLKLDELITRRITLDDTNEAFRAMRDGEVARSVIEVS